MSATVWAGFTATVIGRYMRSLAIARRSSWAIAARVAGAFTSGDFTTTSAGSALPGNARCMRL